MTCLEFRRVLAADPYVRDADVRRHAHECASCAAWLNRHADFEYSLRQAIDVKVPKELAARILLRHGHRESRARVSVHRRWLALAASVLLAVGVAGGLWSLQERSDLEHAVLAEVYNELLARDSRDTVPVAHVNDVWQPIGAVVDQRIGTVYFVSRCPIRDATGGHLIVPGTKGPVSVIAIPAERVRFAIDVRDHRFSGVIVSNGSGSIAVVGEQGEALDAIVARARRDVRFGL